MSFHRCAPALSLAPLILFAFALPVVTSAAHAQTADAADAAGDVPVSLQFAAEIGGGPFACGRSYTGIGRTEGAVAVTGRSGSVTSSIRVTSPPPL